MYSLRKAVNTFIQLTYIQLEDGSFLSLRSCDVITAQILCCLKNWIALICINVEFYSKQIYTEVIRKKCLKLVTVSFPDSFEHHFTSLLTHLLSEPGCKSEGRDSEESWWIIVSHASCVQPVLRTLHKDGLCSRIRKISSVLHFHRERALLLIRCFS